MHQQQSDKFSILPKLEMLFEKHKYGDSIPLTLNYQELAVMVAAIRTQKYMSSQYETVMKQVLDRGLGDVLKKQISEADKLGLTDIIQKGKKNNEG